MTSDKHIPERITLYWIFNCIGIVLPWILIILEWISNPSLPKYISDNVNIWMILFIVWPIFALRISWETVEPDQTGGAYAFGLPLINNLKPGPYLAFPGLVKLDLDSNSNRAYIITAMSNARLEKEMHKTITEKDLQDLNIFRFNEVSTATKEIANWDGFSSEEQVRIEADPNHKQVTLNPSMLVILTIKDFFFYRKNVAGKNPEERKREIGRQLLEIVKSNVNTEFKKRTYAMLIYLQTKTNLDEALRREVNNLIDGYGSEEKGNLGLEAIDARVTALGASEQIHNAVNSVVAEEFNAQAEERKGIGIKNKAIKVAEGNFVALEKEGAGKASALKAKLEVAKGAGVDPAMVAKLDAEIKAFEFSKHTYLTNRQVGSNTNEDIFLTIADMIEKAIRDKEVTNV